jgi:hypothetical protein
MFFIISSLKSSKIYFDGTKLKDFSKAILDITIKEFQNIDFSH